MTRYLMVDGSYGIYVPKRFYDNVELEQWNINKDEYKDLSSPDSEHYWDTWDELVDKAKFVTKDGTEYKLEMDDGDCFVVKVEK